MTHYHYHTNHAPIARAQFAGFFRRFFAIAIDSLLLSMVLSAFAFNYYDGHISWSPIHLFGMEEFMNNKLLPFVLTILFWVYKAATPGKMALDTKVLDAKTGEKPSLKQSVIRYLGYYLSALPLGLGFIWALFDEKNRAWHDLLAGTVVVKHA